MIDAGNDLAVSLRPTDLYGHPRAADGDGFGTATVDMGAVERPDIPVLGVSFHPLPPARMLDTRSGIGVATGKLGPASGLALQVTGQGGVPDAGVSAVVLNVTVTERTAASWLTAYPTGLPPERVEPPTSPPAKRFRTWSWSRSAPAARSTCSTPPGPRTWWWTSPGGPPPAAADM